MVKRDIRQFDYQKVAKLDADMWRAYYNHQFLRMFVLLIRLLRGQFGIDWINTCRAAYYSAKAATDYRLNMYKENYPRVLKDLTKFCKIISDNSLEPFDYKKAAKLELEWWNVHRYPKKHSQDLGQALTMPLAIVYSTPPTKLADYGRYRGIAMLIPDHLGDDQAIPPDWEKIEKLLDKAWRSLHAAIQK